MHQKLRRILESSHFAFRKVIRIRLKDDHRAEQNKTQPVPYCNYDAGDTFVYAFFDCGLCVCTSQDKCMCGRHKIITHCEFQAGRKKIAHSMFDVRVCVCLCGPHVKCKKKECPRNAKIKRNYICSVQFSETAGSLFSIPFEQYCTHAN